MLKTGKEEERGSTIPQRCYPVQATHCILVRSEEAGRRHHNFSVIDPDGRDLEQMFSVVKSFVVRSLIRAADGRLLTGTRRTHTVIVAVPSRNGKRYEGTRSIAVSLGIGSEEIAQRIYKHLTGRDPIVRKEGEFFRLRRMIDRNQFEDDPTKGDAP